MPGSSSSLILTKISIDSAILRRMPKRFPIRLPNLDQRIKILTLASRPESAGTPLIVPQMLSHTKLSPAFAISSLAARTDGLSGSDLRETCRNAVMAPVRELMREKGKTGKEGLEAAMREVSGTSCQSRS